MKKYLYTPVLIFVLVFLSLGTVRVSAQDMRADMKKAGDWFLADKFYYTIEINNYDKAGKKQVMGKGKIAKNGNLYYSEFDNVIFVNAKNNYVMVDRENKQVVYSPAPVQIKKIAVEYEKISGIAAGIKNDNHTYEEKSGQKCYKISLKDYPYKTLEIHLDKATGLLTKMVYTHPVTLDEDEEMPFKTEVIYTRRKNSDVDNNWFKTEKIVKQVSGKPVLQNSYKSYELVY